MIVAVVLTAQRRQLRFAGLFAVAAALVAVVVALVASTRGHQRAGRPPASPGIAAKAASRGGAQEPLLRLTRYLVDNLAARTYPGDREYFDGRWVSGDSSCWMCSTGPGAAAAVLAGFSGQRAAYYKNLAERTFTEAIERYAQPDGAFINPAAPAIGEEIPTIFFGVELGQAYEQLGSSLAPVTRRLWRGTLARAAAFLVHEERALSFYVNGNVNLQITELLYLAWQATGSPALRADYEESWPFLLHPGSRYPGFGLRLTLPYTRPDGSDGSGYLAESGGAAPGFDADYTQLQSDEAARLYLYSRDPRALLLLNLLANRLLQLTSGRWLLNTSNGTRHSAVRRLVPLTTSALAVLAWLGGRRDLKRDLPGQLHQVRLTMCAGLTYSSANLYRAMGNELSVILRAAQLAGAATDANGLPSRVTCPNIPSTLRRRLIS